MPNANAVTAKSRHVSHDATAAYLRYFEGRYEIAEVRKKDFDKNGNGKKSGKRSRPVRKKK